MTTSGLTSSTMIVGEVVVAAMQELGVLSANENPTDQDMTVGMRALNWLLKSFQARGANLWRETNGVTVIPAGVAAGSLSPEIRDLSSVRVAVSATYERPLYRFERDEYMSLPNKSTPGVPTTYYFDRQVSNSNVYVWPVPTIDTTILLDYVRKIEDVTDPEQTVDVPQQWLETVYVSLAVRLASVFGVTRIDPASVQILIQRSAGLERMLLDDDRPASYFIGMG